MAPSITPSATTLTATTNTAITAITFRNSGGAVQANGWSVSPDLPTGLTINPNSGEISGTPTVVTAAATYTVTARNAGGSSTATVRITVNDPTMAPSIIASATTLTATTNTAITPITFRNSGGAVQTNGWSVSPDLPTGLTINPNSGEISGTPTVVTAAATYTVTARNAGGSSTATVRITVNDPTIAPSITPSATTLTATTNTAITAITFRNSGGAVQANGWSVSPDLPTGLTINPNSGEISGTPTVVTAAATYTVTARNVEGSSTATVRITVNPPAPSITPSTSALTATRDTAITAITFRNDGGAVQADGWSVSPDLPTGLTINPNSGEISGTPTVVTAAANYTVTARNVGGNDAVTVRITTVNPPAPSITPSTSALVATRDTAITAITFRNDGGAVQADGWSVSPDLPTGLTINPNTGEISGTPTVVTVAANYTVTARNAGGNDAVTVRITTVNPPAPSITPSTSALVATRDTAITAITFRNDGGAVQADGWSVSPDLPTGLTINPNTGEISGTPTVVTVAANYTVTARNAGGSGTATVRITTVNPPVPSITPSTNALVATRDTVITAITFSNSGGAVQANGWSVSPDLPTGLTINRNSGEISGTPTAVTAVADYSVRARNAGGTVIVTVRITVNPPVPTVPSITPSTSALVATRGTAITPITFSNSGGAVQANGWSVSPDLPTGLTINRNSGEISGTPTAVTATTTVYTVTARNAGGNGTVTVRITVNPPVPFITPSINALIAPTDTAITPITFRNSGSAVQASGWSVSPDLPTGLTINPNTGEISGTPTVVTATTVYTVTARNAAGAGIVSIRITVN